MPSSSNSSRHVLNSNESKHAVGGKVLRVRIKRPPELEIYPRELELDDKVADEEDSKGNQPPKPEEGVAVRERKESAGEHGHDHDHDHDEDEDEIDDETNPPPAEPTKSSLRALIDHESLILRAALVGMPIRNAFQSTIGNGIAAWHPQPDLVSRKEIVKRPLLPTKFWLKSTEKEFVKYTVAVSYAHLRKALYLVTLSCLLVSVGLGIKCGVGHCPADDGYGLGAILAAVMMGISLLGLVVTTYPWFKKEAILRNFRFTGGIIIFTFMMLQIASENVGVFDPTRKESQFGMLFACLAIIHGPPFLRLNTASMGWALLAAVAVILVSLRYWNDEQHTTQWKKSWVYLMLIFVSASVIALIYRLRAEHMMRIHFITLSRFMEEEYHSRQILNRLLPKQIVRRYTIDHVLGKKIIADNYDDVSVMFVRIKYFASRMPLFEDKQVVQLLNDVFTTFDNIVPSHGIFKVETVSEEYLVVAGAPKPNPKHAMTAIACAIELMEVSRQFSWPDGQPLVLSIGIHSGPIICGVLGLKLPRFRMFGDSVNTASRMMSTATPGTIQISAATHSRLVPSPLFSLQCLGEKTVKGKGNMTTYQVIQNPGVTTIKPMPTPCNMDEIKVWGNTVECTTCNMYDEIKSNLENLDDGKKVLMPNVNRVSSWMLLMQLPSASIDSRLQVVERIINSTFRWHTLSFSSEQLERSFFQVFTKHQSTNAHRITTVFSLCLLFVLEFNVWLLMPNFVGPVDSVPELKKSSITGQVLESTVQLYWVSVAYFFFLSLLIIFTIIVISYNLIPENREMLLSVVCIVWHIFPTLVFGCTDPSGMSLVKAPPIFICSIMFFLAANGLGLRCKFYTMVSLGNFLLAIVEYWLLDVLDAIAIVVTTMGILLQWSVSRSTEISLREDFLKQLATELDSLKNVVMIQRLLPIHAVARLERADSAVVADSCPSAVMLFADLVGFTAYASKISEAAVVGLLQELYHRFDKITEEYHVLKVETIGDCYWASSDVTDPEPGDAVNMVMMAMKMLDEVKQVKLKDPGAVLRLRIGLHSGPVLGGVVGMKMPRYHLFGSHVVIAQAMEANGVVDGVNVSGEVVRRLPVGKFVIEERPPLHMPDIGEVPMFLVRWPESAVSPVPRQRIRRLSVTMSKLGLIVPDMSPALPKPKSISASSSMPSPLALSKSSFGTELASDPSSMFHGDEEQSIGTPMTTSTSTWIVPTETVASRKSCTLDRITETE